MTDYQEVPPHWGSDPLSNYLEMSRQNIFATFVGLKPQYNRLNDIHSNLQSIAENMVNSKDWFASFFLMRSHASYLGSVNLAFCGQVVESYMVLRGCLESGLYGNYVSKKPDAGEIWLSRSSGEKGKKKCKNEFTIRNVLNCLKETDIKTYKIAQKLYEITIEYGGHPNEYALLSMMKKSKDDTSINFQTEYLTGNTPQLQLCLKMCASIGVCCLYIFKNVFPERFDILGISEKLPRLSDGL